MHKANIIFNKETKKLYDTHTDESHEKLGKKTASKMVISPVKKKKESPAGVDLVNGMNKMKIDEDMASKTTRGNSHTTTRKIECDVPNDHPMLYIHRENQTLIHNYGPELYECSKDLEVKSAINSKFLSRHKLDPCVRTKMVDWMIEVLYAYNSDAPTFFLAVHIMDLYVSRSKLNLSNNDVHLIGVTCLYLASKMEDIIPLRMNHVKSKIGHNKFSEKEIKKCEKSILETIDFDIISTSTYDFVKTFIFDFCHNNRDSIKALNMKKHIESFDSICIFLSKMMCHSEEFSSCHYSLKAIASIIAGFDILRSNSKNLKKEAESFMRDWVRKSIKIFILLLDSLPY